MSKVRIVELESHQLSDGGTARVTRLGRRYNYGRTFPDDRGLEMVTGVTKDEAYRLLGEALRRDVLDVD